MLTVRVGAEGNQRHSTINNTSGVSNRVGAGGGTGVHTWARLSQELGRSGAGRSVPDRGNSMGEGPGVGGDLGLLEKHERGVWKAENSGEGASVRGGEARVGI